MGWVRCMSSVAVLHSSREYGGWQELGSSIISWIIHDGHFSSKKFYPFNFYLIVVKSGEIMQIRKTIPNSHAIPTLRWSVNLRGGEHQRTNHQFFHFPSNPDNRLRSMQYQVNKREKPGKRWRRWRSRLSMLFSFSVWRLRHNLPSWTEVMQNNEMLFAACAFSLNTNTSSPQ